MFRVCFGIRVLGLLVVQVWGCLRTGVCLGFGVGWGLVVEGLELLG